VGANVNAKTNKGVTASMIAFNRGEDEIVQLLKEAGAKE
jgi:ankyrin repeat protein